MFNYILYRIGQFIALALPLSFSYKLAVFISDVHYIFAFHDRRWVSANLKAIFPEKPDREIRRIMRAMFRNFAKYLVDFFRFSILSSDYIKKNIKVENTCYLDEALTHKKGVIGLTAHIGNWELGGAVIALLGYPFWIVALPHKHVRINEFFNSQRESKGVKVIPLGRAVKQCLNVLKENKLLGLAGDRNFNEKGALVDFFGKPTYFPIGPAVFAINAGAVIVPAFMVRNPDDTFTLKFEKLLIYENYRDEKNKNLTRVISSYTAIFENYIRKYPEQWYMFRRFWA